MRRGGTACSNPKLRPNASRLLQHDFMRDVADTQIRHTSSSFDSPRQAPAGHAPPAAELPLTDDVDAAADSLHLNSTGDEDFLIPENFDLQLHESLNILTDYLEFTQPYGSALRQFNKPKEI